jgi:hypothetical protein
MVDHVFKWKQYFHLLLPIILFEKESVDRHLQREILLVFCVQCTLGCNYVYKLISPDVYKEYHSFRRNWVSPNPSLASECAPLPRTWGGGHTCLRVRGLGSPNSDDWRKSFELCLLCGPDVEMEAKVYSMSD